MYNVDDQYKDKSCKKFEAKEVKFAKLDVP